MKTLLLISGLLLTTALQAQEQQLATNTTERAQPVITEAKVEKDAQMAREMRSKAKDDKKQAKEDKSKKEGDQRLSTANITSSAKKTSKKPGEQ